MSKKLAKLLDRPEAEIAKLIEDFEKRSGYPSADVRLVAEAKQKLRTKIGQLGLDPDDTTEEELYHALQARFTRDSAILDKALGVNSNTEFTERLAKASQLAGHCASVDQMWVIKNSVTKSLLSKNPPKQVAKSLHYRSNASLIKREDVNQIYLLAWVIESSTWRKNVTKKISKLSSSDYELRSIKIIRFSSAKYSDVEGPGSYIVSNVSLGSVAIWPSADLQKASVLSLSLLLLDAIQSLQSNNYSESLDELSPALRWWADTNYLISDGDLAVSLNVKDVSWNQLKDLAYQNSTSHHAKSNLWQELESRYKSIAASISDTISDIEYSAQTSGLSQPKLPVVNDLATEYAIAEQN